MKKYIFLALAVVGLAACTNDDLGGDNGPAHSGEIEESYIAINLSAAEGTRAADGIYQAGEANERAVANAHFFFFKDDEPFVVNQKNAPATAPGGGVNHLAATLTGSKDGMDNVSDIKDAVLLLSTYKGEYPNQIVAVLNWNPDADKSYTLQELKDAMADIAVSYDENKYFTMSNAVYANNAGDVVNTAPLTVDNIKSTETDAKAAPVTIYVERLAAKVTVTTTDGTHKFKLDKKATVGGSEVDVYAHILGWELYNDNTKSYLLKQINPLWVNDPSDTNGNNVGFNWNDPAWFRSYWAISMGRPDGETNTFKMTYTDAEQTANGFATAYGFNVGSKVSVDAGSYTAGSFTYIGENTNGKNDGTKVILKAKLDDEAGAGDGIEIGLWNGVQYVGNLALRTAVANTLKYTLYYLDGNSYVGLKPEDLECVQGGNGTYPNAAEINGVYFQLSDDAENKDWYKLVSGNYVPVAPDKNTDPGSIKATNEYLAINVKPAVLYTNGETFYYVDIKHLGAEGSNGEYGVVRNHIYDVMIKTIGGYGSPVYEGTSDLVVPEYPEVPGEDESFVSAQINILSWRLVSQEVDIQPQN